jgi:UDP-glucose 6-dehydrogenase
MKILMIGAGNIGLISALCLAEKGQEVFCIDSNQIKVNKLMILHKLVIKMTPSVSLRDGIKKFIGTK